VFGIAPDGKRLLAGRFLTFRSRNVGGVGRRLARRYTCARVERNFGDSPMMVCPSRYRVVTLVAVLSLLAAAPSAADWKRLDTPNLIVVGDVSARELRDVATKFEGFRDTLRQVVSESAARAAVPTVVIVFPNEKAFTPFKPTYQGKPREGVRGYYAAGPYVDYIAMESGSDVTDRVIFHEYAHQVVSNSMRNVPVWLGEGLAEYYSTFRLVGGRTAHLGEVIVDHVRVLRSVERYPLSTLLTVDHNSMLYNESARASVFYAQAWALTHMLLNGDRPRAKELGAYLGRVQKGVPEMEAWEQTLGTARTENDLLEYLARTAYRTILIDLPERVLPTSATVVPLSPVDAEAFLAGLLIQGRRFEEADARLTTAFKVDGASLQLNAVRAQYELRTQQSDAALKRLLDLPQTDDWFAAYLAGSALADLSEARSVTSNGALAAQARRQLERVRQQRGDIPNVLGQLGALALLDDTASIDEARATIARARALAPGRTEYAIIEAQLLTRAGDFAAARTVLGPLMDPSYPADVGDQARRNMAWVVDAERRRTQTASDAAATTTVSRPVPVPSARIETGPTGDNGRRRFIPTYRTLQPGEERLEGFLARIDCSARSVAFQVKQAAEVTTIKALRMADVDFISYRDDLTGAVGCGTVRDPTHVYATWRPGTTAGEKVAVAIEFLPAN